MYYIGKFHPHAPGLADASVHKVLFLQTRMKSDEAASLVATSLQGRTTTPLYFTPPSSVVFGQGCVYFWNHRTSMLMGCFSAVSTIARCAFVGVVLTPGTPSSSLPTPSAPWLWMEVIPF